MSKLMRNVLLLAKLETVVGTDPVPTAGANAILARTIGAQPITAEFADRNNIKAYFGSSGKVQVSNYSTIDFEIELAGSGTAGTAPAYGPLLQACAFSETIVAVTSVTYTPITTAPKTVTIYYYLDGVRHIMTSCRGNVSFELNSKSIPVMKFKFTGLFNTGTDTALPGGEDYSAFIAPQAVNKVNTPSWSIHGATGALESATFDMSNQVTYRNLIGSESVAMIDRAVTGQARLEMTSIATYAWHEAVRLGTLGALSVVHGVGAGSIITIAAPAVQLTSPSYSDSDGIAMLDVSMDIQPDAGNDEITIALT